MSSDGMLFKSVNITVVRDVKTSIFSANDVLWGQKNTDLFLKIFEFLTFTFKQKNQAIWVNKLFNNKLFGWDDFFIHKQLIAMIFVRHMPCIIISLQVDLVS